MFTRLTFASQLSHFFRNSFLKNSGLIILKLYNVLVQVQFSASKVKLGILYNKLSTRVTSHNLRVRTLGN